MVLQEFKEIMLHFFFVFGQTTKQPLPLLWGKREFKGRKSAVFAVLQISFICSHRAFTKSWLNHTVFICYHCREPKHTELQKCALLCIVNIGFKQYYARNFCFIRFSSSSLLFERRVIFSNIDIFFYKMLLPHSRYPKIF